MVRIALVRFRWEIVSLKQTSKGKRLTVPTSANWLSIRNAMMGPGRRLHFALDRRSASPIQPQITNYLILDPRECIYASLQCIFADAHGYKSTPDTAKHHLNEFTSEDDSLEL